MNLVPVILSGGIGSRLWPYSRSDFPKPFIRLPDGESLFTKTVERAYDLRGVEDIIIVCNKKYAHLTNQTLEALDKKSKSFCIWEPEARNTAAAIAVAAKFAQNKWGDDTLLLVLPSDHLIQNESAFKDAVNAATEYARLGRLVTFGIKPDSIETGYGYIEHENENVVRFIEKPDFETAKALINTKKVVWNAGMFCFTASQILNEISSHFNELSIELEKLHLSVAGNELEFSAEEYSKLPEQSIDYAVMEKSSNLAVVACSIGWDDIGSWTSYAKLLKDVDEEGNVKQGNVVAINSQNNVILGNDRLVATVGVDNLVVVTTEGATLIARKDLVQDVKKLAKLPQVTENEFAQTQRPWGTYQVIDRGNGYKVKRIEVFPGGMLSLQLHHHRDEHWTIVSGEAYVTKGEDVLFLKGNDSVFIPKTIKHRLHNRSNKSCVLIEVQYGDYLGEDDIVRLEDKYKRC